MQRYDISITFVETFSVFVENSCKCLFSTTIFAIYQTNKTNNMKKKWLLLLATCFITTLAKADNYPYFTFATTDGTLYSMSSEQLIITFSDGALVANNGTEKYKLSLTSLSDMYFSTSNISGIESISSLTLDGAKQIYSLSGIYLGKYENLQDFISQAQTGVYIVKVNGKSYKVVVK